MRSLRPAGDRDDDGLHLLVGRRLRDTSRIAHDPEAYRSARRSADTAGVGQEEVLTRACHLLGQPACSPGEIVAIENGLRSRLALDRGSNRYEQLLHAHARTTGGVAHLLAGASRRARTIVDVADTHHRVLRDVTAGVAGPIITGWLVSVIATARRCGVTTLYFTARDGQLLVPFADRLIQGGGPAVRYLHGSRRAWLIPAVADQGAETIVDAAMRFCLASEKLSVAGLLDVLELTRDRRVVGALEAGVTRDRWNSVLGPTEQAAVRAALIDDEVLASAIESRAQAARDRMVRFLHGQGLGGGGRVGLVDLGAGATQFRMLRTVLDTLPGACDVVGFNWALTRRLPPELEVHPYLYDAPQGLGEVDRQLLSFLETVCTADHPTVATYREGAEGEVEPVFNACGHAPLADWGRDTVARTLGAFVDALDSDELHTAGYALTSVDLRPASIDLYRAFWDDPSRDEARSWGAFPVEYDHLDEITCAPLASPYRLRDLPVALVFGRHPRHHFHGWGAGSARLSRPWIQVPMRLIIGASVARPVRVARERLKRLTRPNDSGPADLLVAGPGRVRLKQFERALRHGS